LDDRRRDGGTNFILRIKEQETCLTFHEHDDDDGYTIKIKIHIFRYIYIYLTGNVNWIVNVWSISSKLGEVCYTLKGSNGPHVTSSSYSTNFHPHLHHGLIFWGCDTESIRTFKLQKRVMQISWV